MPWVTIELMAGHSEDKKRKLHEEVAKAVYQTLEIPTEHVKIHLVEMSPIDHSIGGIAMDKFKK
ncbi:MAG: tautomerase family protein [Bdellovibrionales bacterium]|jgi:4-oxalocrotonate tautomerase family enzyme